MENVYIQTSKGNLFGFNEDGKEELNVKVISESNQSFEMSSICGYNNYIFLVSQTTGAVKWDDVKGIIYCVDVDSKKIKWQKKFPLGIWKLLGEYATLDSTPIIVNNEVWILSTNGVLYGFDVDTGERRGGRSFAFISQGNGYIRVYSSPCSIGNTIYIPVLSQWYPIWGTTIYAYDTEKGTLWEKNFGGNILASLASTKDHIFVPLSGYPDSTPKVVAIDKDGKEEPITVWEGETKETDVSSFCIADGKLFFVSSDYNLRCFVEDIGDFSISLPEEIDIGTGESKSFNIEVKKEGNFPFDITPSITSQQEGISVSFKPDKIKGEGVFEVTISIDENTTPGEYNLKFIFTSERRTHEANVKVLISDKTPPTVKLLDGDLSDFINSAELELNIGVSDNVSNSDEISSFFSLDGSEWKKIEDLHLLLKDLSEGKHTLLVKALDEAGNESEPLKIEFVVDTTPPNIEITSPEDNFYTSEETLNIKGSISDSLSGVDKLIVNGEEISIKENGIFEKEITLSEGENKIKIKAYDKAGNKQEKTLRVYLDKTPPELFVNIPDKVNDPHLTITGSVKDNLSGIEYLKINEEDITISSDGSFSYTLTLNEGENTITFELEDKAGNKTDKTFTVNYIKRIILKLQIGNKVMLVNDEPKEIDVPPTIVEGRTLLPIRWVAEPLGADIGWDGKERKVTVSLNDTTIELWIGKPTVRVNGEYKPIDPNNPKVVPMILNGRTMLPVRFIAENLGCKVDWDGTTKTVTIIYPGD